MTGQTNGGPNLKLLTTTTASPGQPEVVCPVDGATIHWDEAGLTCLSCGRTWDRDGNVPLFVGPTSDTAADSADLQRSDAPTRAARHDWRFRLPIDESSRVLEMGTRDDLGAVSLAFEAGSVIALRQHAADAVALERRARELELGTLLPIATPLGVLPIPDRSLDVAVIHDALGMVARESTIAGAQRSLLRALFRKLTLGGLLWAEVPNRFALDRAGWGWARGNGRHGLGGLRRLLAENGFPETEVFAILHLGGRRECLPVTDPTVFDFAWRRAARDLHPSPSRFRKHGDELVAAAARRAFRAGWIPRTASGFAVLARRGAAK